MEVYLHKHIDDKRFDQLKIPFACAATDLQTGERVVFREGSVALAARASATIPGMFEPVVFRHRYLVDGGLVSNIPTDLTALMGADIIIAVDVTSDFSRFTPHTMLSALNQAIYIQSEAMSQAGAGARQFCDPARSWAISAPIDLTRSAECIDAGSLATRRAVPGIKRLLVDKNFDLLDSRLQTGRTLRSVENSRSLSAVLCGRRRPVVAAAETRGSEGCAALQRSIDRASEAREFFPRADAAFRAGRSSDAGTGPLCAAARQYELLLASRPAEHERVKFFIKLGKMRDAVEDYSGAINAYQDALHDDPKSWDANLALARAYAR